MASQQLVHNLTNHPPKDESVIGRFEQLRSAARALGHEIEAQCPESRERSLALTNRVSRP